MNHRIAPEVFFYIEEDSIVLWNCSTHEQYILAREYFFELLTVAKTGKSENSKIFNELEAAGIIQQSASNSCSWGWDLLSRLFHVGTKDVPHIDLESAPDKFANHYITECEQNKRNIPDLFQDKNTTLIDLPKPSLALKNTTLSTSLKNRKTSRSFNGEQISLQELSDLLFATFGLIHGEWNEADEVGLKIVGVRKSSPSSGGLHAEEAYLTIFHVDGLDPGLYYYRPQDHKLNLLQLGDFEDKTINFNNKQFFSKGLAFGIYITARLDKYWWKYQHSRTYRVMLLDVGHVSQTFLLAATALGLNTWVTGIFEDSAVESFLGINGYNESVIFYVGAGHGESVAFPQAFYANHTL